MENQSQRLDFEGHSGARLAARLDLPSGTVRAYALFAHCFTCSKDIVAARRISAELTKSGIAVLRFDFTGLGASGGEFASTNFTSNVDDLVAAADYLEKNFEGPSLLIGHSLGGAAMVVAAARIPSAKAVVTIGAPADAGHVIKNFGSSLDEIRHAGEADVTLAGRTFTIRRQFIEDAGQVEVAKAAKALKLPLLILHAPLDGVVGIDNAAELFTAARHPKSFVSLDHADHLLTDPRDAQFAATVIAGWFSRYLPEEKPQGEERTEHVRVTETRQGRFQNMVKAGPHRMFADEPVSAGGFDSGPSPYDYLSAGLAACTSMTLRMYADFKKIPLGRITVDVSHRKLHASDCLECTDEMKAGSAKIDRFERQILIDGDMPPELADKIAEIADKCPVHKTLETRSVVVTRLVDEIR